MQVGSTFLRFQDNRELTVNDIDGAMAILDTGEKVAIQRLMDRNKFELISVGSGKATVANTNESVSVNQGSETFDLSSSAKNLASMLSGELSNIDTSTIREIPDAPSVKMEGVVENSKPKTVVENANVDPKKAQELLNKYKQEDKKIKKGQTLADIVNAPDTTIPTPQVKKDSAEDFFRGIKRTEDLELEIKVNEKIPNKTFIIAMEENHEKSIVEYLANDIFNNIMKNPKELKKNIEDALREKIGISKENNQENAKD